MKIVSLRIEGFKRFAEPTVLRFRGQSMAILGANESGKTSVLEALEHLGAVGFPAASQFTDRQARPAEATILSARFQLEPADVSAITELLKDRPVLGTPAVDEPWTLLKRADGDHRFLWASGLQRDVSFRGEWAADIERYLDEDWKLLPTNSYAEESLERIRLAAVAAAESLDTDSDALTTEALTRLTDLGQLLEVWATTLQSPNDSLDAWRGKHREFLAEERADPPDLEAGRLLYGRLPSFVPFEGEARDLPSFTPFTQKPRAALVNLLSAADSTFEHLASLAGTAGAFEYLKEEERRINLQLERLFRDWSQREVSAAVGIDTSGIAVLVRDRAAPILDAPMSQRSAGMRMFAALLAFLNAKNVASSSSPVLLVDEAELHLHYDAQADLVRIFDQQDLAQVVIYTTHSIGCLPEDLGLGVTVVEECGEERSRLSQSFWTKGPGITPLMLALGATALSFTPARRVVIGEGAHEAILLPTLLRQARESADKQAPLGFQVVGGLSEISPDAAAQLDEEAGTVVYLIDNDAGGSAVKGSLPRPVVDAGRVLVLGDGTDIACIEDCVAAEVLIEAIRTVIAADGGHLPTLTAVDVPPAGRAKWIDRLFVQCGMPKSRTRVAQAAVLIGAGARLVQPERRETLTGLLASINALFPEV